MEKKSNSGQSKLTAFLGHSFDNFKVVDTGSGLLEHVAKSRAEIQIEYSAIDRLLNDKLSSGELSDDEHTELYAELINLKTQYDANFSPNNQQQSQDENSPLFSSAIDATEQSTRTSQVNTQSHQIREQEQHNKLLEELGDLVDYIDEDLMDNSEYLSLLCKYKYSFEGIPPEEFVDFCTNAYYDAINSKENDKDDKIDQTDDFESIR